MTVPYQYMTNYIISSGWMDRGRGVVVDELIQFKHTLFFLNPNLTFKIFYLKILSKTII